MTHAKHFKGPAIDFETIDLGELTETFAALRDCTQLFVRHHETIKNIQTYTSGELTPAEEHEFLESMIELAASGQLAALYEGLNVMALENEYLKALLVATKQAGGGAEAIERHIQHDNIAQQALVTLIENAQVSYMPGNHGVQLVIRIKDHALWQALQELAVTIKTKSTAIKTNRVSPRQQYEARQQKGQ